MSVPLYQEPLLAVTVLDFKKPIESRLCLESIKRHVKVPHTVIFCDNGSGEDYPLQFVREGLVDQLIVNRDSRGLGLGTQDLFALTQAWWTIYQQNDQVFVRDLTDSDLSTLTSWIGGSTAKRETIASISLAGAPCGDGIYSERSYLVRTSDYHRWEKDLYLGYHGAGPYHNGIWREKRLQDHYASSRLTHLAWPAPYVADNGVFAVRDMKEAGLYCHRTDTKRLWCIRQPETPILNPAYPTLTEEEHTMMVTGGWPDEGRIPELERVNSFDCWSQTTLGSMEAEYIADLRRRAGGAS